MKPDRLERFIDKITVIINQQLGPNPLSQNDLVRLVDSTCLSNTTISARVISLLEATLIEKQLINDAETLYNPSQALKDIGILIRCGYNHQAVSASEIVQCRQLTVNASLNLGKILSTL